jgi:hypothetical protein
MPSRPAPATVRGCRHRAARPAVAPYLARVAVAPWTRFLRHCYAGALRAKHLPVFATPPLPPPGDPSLDAQGDRAALGDSRVKATARGVGG